LSSPIEKCKFIRYLEESAVFFICFLPFDVKEAILAYFGWFKKGIPGNPNLLKFTAWSTTRRKFCPITYAHLYSQEGGSLVPVVSHSLPGHCITEGPMFGSLRLREGPGKGEETTFTFKQVVVEFIPLKTKIFVNISIHIM